MSSEKKSNITTIGSDTQRIWSNYIFIFQTYISQTFEQSLRWFSILLENKNFENPENCKLSKKIGKQVIRISTFWKSENQFMLKANLLLWLVSWEKSQIPLESGWTDKKCGPITFSFSNCCHTDFLVIASVIFHFVIKWICQSQQKCCH